MSVMTPGERQASLAGSHEPRLIIDLDLHRSRPDEFTARQKEILRLVAQGAGNADIAAALSLSKRTVDKHIERIHMKAGTSTRARLVAFATAFVRLERREP